MPRIRTTSNQAALLLAGHEADPTDAHDASAISSVPAGNLASTNVQSALNELDTEKAPLATAVMDGDAAGGALSGTYPNPGFAVDMATQAELDTLSAAAVLDGDAAGGVLAGTYPNPSFAADMATQAELDAHAGAADPHTVYLKESDFDDVDFLVGTATGHTGAEIVVGTVPGGELGGTWASPTVDTTHSGSSHSGVISTHEGAADPHPAYLKESDFDDIDFLVGTATGLTAAEIVVGTSPGGELGGTWASPTVDATHSGSSHSGVVSAHEAASDPHTAYLLSAGDTMTGHLLFSTDNTIDIGASGATRPRTLYLGTSLITPSATVTGLSAGQVVFPDGSGVLTGASTLHYSIADDRLSVNKLRITSLATANRVVYRGVEAGGQTIYTSDDLQFNGSTVGVGGALLSDTILTAYAPNASGAHAFRARGTAHATKGHIARFEQSDGTLVGFIDNDGVLVLDDADTSTFPFRRIKIGNSAHVWSAGGGDVRLAANLRYDGSNYRYIDTGAGIDVATFGGNFGVFVAPSGTAGDVASPAGVIQADYSGSPRLSFYGASLTTRQTVAAAASDLASVITLANSLRTMGINVGLYQA